MASPSLLQRLKERKLVQWALAYLAGAWVIYEGTGTAFETWNVPVLLVRSVHVLLIIGFFITLVLAWYHGEKGRQRVGGPELLMVGGLLIVAGVAISRLGGSGDSGIRPLSREGDDRPGIAVLVCRDISPDPEDVYYAEGFHEQILSTLQKISSLFSVGPASVRWYQENPVPPRQVAEELGVETIGDCSVRKDQDRIRVSFQLLDGKTGEQLWAEDYDRVLNTTNLFDIQSEIAREVALTIGAELTPDERDRIETKPTESLQAYDLYLLGRSYFKGLDAPALERAIDLFEQAISLDPGFAKAYAGLADTYAVLTMGWGRSPLDVFPKVRDAAEQALLLDPTLSEAHASLGIVHLLFDWRMAEAEEAFRRAVELDSNSANARHWLAVSLMSRGRHTEALREIRRALELDPLSPHINLNVGYLRYVSGDSQGAVDHFRSAMRILPDQALLFAFRGVAQAELGNLVEAIEDLERAVDLSQGDNLIPLPYLGYVYGLAGRETDARRVLQDLHEISQRQFVNPDYFSILHLGLNEVDEAMEWLYKAQEARTDWAFFFPVDPMAAPLRSDPRFVELVRSNGLEEALR